MLDSLRKKLVVSESSFTQLHARWRSSHVYRAGAKPRWCSASNRMGHYRKHKVVGRAILPADPLSSGSSRLEKAAAARIGSQDWPPHGRNQNR